MAMKVASISVVVSCAKRKIGRYFCKMFTVIIAFI